MVQPCNPQHIPNIAYYCQEKKMGICPNCHNKYKSQGYSLNLISEIIKIQLIDLKTATIQALKLNEMLSEICNNYSQNQLDSKTRISEAFDKYIDYVIKIKQQILADIESKIPSISISEIKNFKKIIGNLDKTIKDSENYKSLINNLLGVNDLYQCLQRMQDISVKQWIDEMINIRKLINQFTSSNHISELYSVNNVSVNERDVLSHVGISLQNRYIPKNTSPRISIPPPRQNNSSKNFSAVNPDPGPQQNTINQPSQYFNPNLSPHIPNTKSPHFNQQPALQSLQKYADNTKPDFNNSFETLQNKGIYTNNQDNMASQQPKYGVRNNIQNTIPITSNANEMFNNPSPLKFFVSSDDAPDLNNTSKIGQSSTLSFSAAGKESPNQYPVPHLYFFGKDRFSFIDLDTKQIGSLQNPFSIEFPSSAFPFYYVNEGIFLNGGLKNGQVLHFTYLFNCFSKEFIKKSDMIEGRVFHSVSKVGSNILYTLGGNNSSNNSLSTCEKYNLTYDHSERVSNMQYPKSGGCSLCIEGRYLYSFSGWIESIKQFSNSIEKIDILNEEGGWITIQNMSNAWFNNAWLAKIGMNTVEIENSVFLLFGGKNDKNISDGCFVFDKSEKLRPYSSNLAVPASFYFHCGQPIVHNNNVYTVCDSKLVHCLNLKSEIWTIDKFYNLNNF